MAESLGFSSQQLQQQQQPGTLPSIGILTNEQRLQEVIQSHTVAADFGVENYGTWQISFITKQPVGTMDSKVGDDLCLLVRCQILGNL